MDTQQRGPFDRLLRTNENGEPQGPDRAAIYIGGTIIGLALLLLILVLPPVSILSRGGGGGSDIPGAPGDADTYTSTVRTGIPKLPAGLVAASALFDLAAPEEQRGASAVTVPLKEQQTEARNLALYTYIDSSWQRLSDATLVATGTAARGEVSALPGNVIVLKRSKSTLQIAGSMPAGTTIDERAASVITTLHPIVFIPIENGSIIGAPPAVPPAGYNVVPAIVAPNAEVVDNILRSAELRGAHVQALAGAVRQGNFAGIMIDYRNVSPALKEQYTAFVVALSDALEEDGRTLTLSLPMPKRVDGEIDEGAYDWERLGAAADSLEMAGDLDQELYFQDTEAALEYVTQQTDRAKISITIPSYAIERGSDGLRSFPIADALSIASIISVGQEGEITTGAAVPLVAQNLATSEGGTGMIWDDTARSVTFRYPGRGGQRTVWIANEFSASFRLELARRYELGGVTIPDVSQEGGGADVWSPVQQLAETGELTLSKPNGDLLAPVWTASAGSLSTTTGDSVTWTAPAQASDAEITIVVSDGVIRIGQRVTVTVQEPVAAEPPAE